MAENLSVSPIPPTQDDIVNLLYIEIQQNDKKTHHGFKVDYLTEELSEMQRDFLQCTKCFGIARDALRIGEDTLCRSCCIQQKHYASVDERVRRSVARLTIRCPLLRNCDWVGYILEGEEHLRECGCFLIECPEQCGAIIERSEEDNHVATCCPMFQVNCNYCGGEFYRLELTDHLTTCPSYPINCTECGEGMHRFERSIHIDTVCQMAEIECPYAKYSCKIGKIIRRDLLAHKKESYIEHQDMIEEENCLLKQELSKLKLKQEKNYNQLKLGKKDLGGVEIKIDPTLRTNQTIVFHSGSYEFSCDVIVDDVMRASLTRIPSRNGNDNKTIFVTCCIVYLRESTIEKRPNISRENLYSKMETNDAISVCILERETYRKYIQEDGRLYLKVLFDYD